MKKRNVKIVTVVGARPQFIKAAVLRKQCPKFDVNEILVHTGQHYDHEMSDIFFIELGIRPAEYKLALTKRSHSGMTAEIMEQIEKILIKEVPDWCVVYGDTNSTLAAALAAAKLNIPVCHIEAGLRSFNKKMPEEINRILTDHVSDLLFCPTSAAVSHLGDENITKGVHHVGDIMHDAVKLFTQEFERAELLKQFKISDTKPIALVTLHRAETLSSKDRLQNIIDYVRDFDKEYQLVFPIHPNTRKKCTAYGISLEGFHLLPPQPYQLLQGLLSSSELVITDSGGLQKEAYFHKTRCLTLRDETEWTETIDAGWNRLWRQPEYKCEPENIDEYGDGTTAEQILTLLCAHSSR